MRVVVSLVEEDAEGGTVEVREGNGAGEGVEAAEGKEADGRQGLRF